MADWKGGEGSAGTLRVTEGQQIDDPIERMRRFTRSLPDRPVRAMGRRSIRLTRRRRLSSTSTPSRSSP